MSNLHNDADLYGDDHPVVNAAVEALRAFGDDLTRDGEQ